MFCRFGRVWTYSSFLVTNYVSAGLTLCAKRWWLFFCFCVLFRGLFVLSWYE